MALANEINGNLEGKGLRIAIGVSRFNLFVTQKLLEGAKEALTLHGVMDEDILVAWVPGSFELPVAAKTMAETGRYDAIICLGAVIRGETDHYELVSENAASGIGRVALDTGVPVCFGVLATDKAEQAIDRAGGKSGNLGYSAALVAIETVRLLEKIKLDLK